MSTRKDCIRGIGIYKAPSHLSAEAFEDKLQAHMDELMVLPAAKKVLQCDLVSKAILYQVKSNDRTPQMIPNKNIEEEMTNAGLPGAQSTIVVLMEWEVSEHICAT
jgi:hypothetical protein